MDQVSRNNFGALYFDIVAPAPLPKHRILHDLNRLAKQFLSHPPEPSASSSRDQKNPISIFRKLLPANPGSKPGGRHRGLGPEEGSEQKAASWDAEWSMTPHSMIPHNVLFSQAGLGVCALPTNFEQARPFTSPADGPSGSLYSPKSALIDALGLASDRVIAIEPRPYSQPRIVSQTVDRHGQGIKFASSIVKPTPSQARILRRKSRYPHPMILSPPRRAQTSLPASKKVPHGTPGHSLRKPSSSSRRTSRVLMIGHNPIGPPPHASQRQSISSSLSSVIQSAELDQPLTGVHRRSSRYIQALERKSKMSLPAESILPPLEIYPLTFSPFLTEFSDRPSSVGSSSSTAPSTPSVKTPPSSIITLIPTTSQKDLRDQKILRRYGRCPSTFPNVSSGSPTALFFEQAQKDVILAVKASTLPASFSCPPRSDSLRGCSRAGLGKAMETTERTRSRETKSVPSKVALRPKLTLQIPQTRNSSQSTIIHGPGASIRVYSRARPLLPIPITRQQTL